MRLGRGDANLRRACVVAPKTSSNALSLEDASFYTWLRNCDMRRDDLREQLGGAPKSSAFPGTIPYYLFLHFINHDDNDY